MMLTQDMKRVIEQQRLGFVATAAPDGTPNVSPKGTNPRIEVNFVDVFVRKGYRFAGTGKVVERGEAEFEHLLPKLGSALAHRIRAIVIFTVSKALPLTSPAYDDGKVELELRRAWTARFRKLQPGERFEE